MKTVEAAFKQRWPLMLLATLIGLAVGGLLTAGTPRTYEAQSQLYIDIRGGDPALQSSDSLLSRYYLQQVTSDRVLSRTIVSLGLSPTTPTDLRPRVTGEALKGTNIVVIHARAGSPKEAARLADGVARAVVEQNEAESRTRLARAHMYLAAELLRLSDAIKQVGDINATRPDYASALQSLTSLQAQYTATYAKLQDIELAQDRDADSITILQRASIPAQPISPDPVRYLAGGLLIGLATGVLFGLLVHRLDDRLRSAEALAEAAGTSLVIVVPKDQGSIRLGTSYGLALANLVARFPKLRTVMTTGATPAERVQEVAAGLGMAAVEQGTKAVVVLRSAEAGENVGSIIQGSNGHRLETITLTSSQQIRERLSVRRQELSFVSVPSPNASPDAAALASVADAVVLIATESMTRESDVRRAAQILREAGGNVAAGMLVPRKRHRKRNSDDQE